MPIYALGSDEPTIASTAYIHPDAVIIGAVSIGEESSVWACTVLRGDHGGIVIGAQTSVQDGTVVHTTPFSETIVGDRVTIGHNAHLEGCRVHDEALIGSGAVVLHRAIVGEGAIVGSCAFVGNGKVVPPLSMALGVPATVKEGVVEPGTNLAAARAYVWRTQRYPAELRRLD